MKNHKYFHEKAAAKKWHESEVNINPKHKQDYALMAFVLLLSGVGAIAILAALAFVAIHFTK